MIRIIFITFLLSNISYSACKIESYKHILKLNKVLDASIIKHSTCEKSLIDKFLSMVSNFNGNVKTSHLAFAINQELSTNISIEPAMISVEGLNISIKKNLSSALLIGESHTLHAASSFSSNTPIDSSIECNNCTTAGSKNFKMTVLGKSFWVTTNLKEKSFALISKRSLHPSNNSLDMKDFEKIELTHDGKKQFFSDYENIRFYKTMRPLKSNQPLGVNDVTPKIIIKANKMVEITLQSNTIELKTRAIARQSARLGESIEFYNPKTKKRITAKAIDFNKAVINL